MNIIITDGGNREGTYGSFRIYDHEGTLLVRHSTYWGIGDHNQAEYWTLLSALESALTIGVKDVIIFSDSETVVKQIMCERPLHAEKLKVIKDKVEELLEQFNKWEIQYVSRILIKSFLGH
jgi:ribonuclease HI